MISDQGLKHLDLETDRDNGVGPLPSTSDELKARSYRVKAL